MKEGKETGVVRVSRVAALAGVLELQGMRGATVLIVGDGLEKEVMTVMKKATNPNLTSSQERVDLS